MKTLAIALATLLFSPAAFAQQPYCYQTQFSGEVKQGERFQRDLGSGVRLDIRSVHFQEDLRWAWFIVGARGGDGDVFVFQQSDANWLLASNDFWNVLIGGVNRDVAADLRRQSRYLLVPLSKDDMLKARESMTYLGGGSTPQQVQKALEQWQIVRFGHAEFVIKDYALGPGSPPMSVDWIKFEVKLTVPSDFSLAGDGPVAMVDCPAIPIQVIDDIAHPDRHHYAVSDEKTVKP